MTVLLVGPKAPPFGGMAVQGDLLAQNLTESGVTVLRLVTNPRLIGPLGWPFLRTIVSTIVFLWRMMFSVRRARVIHILAASGFYFFARNLPVIVWARCRGARVVVNYRGGLAEAFLRRHGRWALPVLRWAHAITVPSAFLERVFAAHDVATTVVPNICELDRFTYRERPRPRPRILVNRNLEPMYNIGLAIDAFDRVRRAHPDARLTIAGVGSVEPELRERARPLGDSVVFVGRVDHADMPSVLAEHDISVNPTNVDNMPISVLEAFASGVYTVSTNVGGVPDLLEHEIHGLLVPPGDAEAMAAAIHRVLTDPSLGVALTRRARDHAATFAWERIRSRLFEAYARDATHPEVPNRLS